MVGFGWLVITSRFVKKSSTQKAQKNQPIPQPSPATGWLGTLWEATPDHRPVLGDAKAPLAVKDHTSAVEETGGVFLECLFPAKSGMLV